METAMENKPASDILNGLTMNTALIPDALICVSHLRWNFVFQRPQHLMTRAAKQYRVFYVEEPVFGDADFLERL